MVLPETAIGALLSASFQVLFDRLASQKLLEFFQSKDFDETLLHRLKITLLSVHAVLSDAEEKQITNPIVKQWVEELKDAAYQAEDFLDEISLALQCNIEAESPGCNKQLQNSISRGISRLEKIISRLEHIAKSKDVLGLKESPGVKPSPRLPSTSLVDESKVYGRDNDKEGIKKLLLSDFSPNELEIPIIALVGIGGVGKTTLAQLLYNDPEVKKHFPTRAWVHVSEEFNVLKVTKTVFESVTSNFHCKITDLNAIQVKLKEKLGRKRFFLVLDDVWNENFMHWDVLKKPFGDGDVRSRIIVTTRNQSVASIMHAVLIHPLQPLSDEDCLSVFKKYAFRRANINGQQNLKGIGEQIVKKCKGLPLAAETLGSLFYSKRDQTQEWDKILNSKIWDLPMDKSNILPSLRLSYYYLPSYLKQCFAYCSIFPKGYAFEKEKLVLLWMAEGFLQQPTNEQRLEEIGHEYFHELVSRSFFQQLSGNKSLFIMHDLITELAQFASGEFCFKIDDGKPHVISEKARHFSYVRDQLDGIENFEALHELKFLRTFLPLSFSSNPGGALSLNKMVIEDLMLTKKCLRVLSLCRYEIGELPDTFHNLKHLRYLDLSRTKIKKLPQSTCFLYNLQILLLSNCFNLIELPENMRNLSKLVHLDVSGTKLKEMPPDFGKLKNLQTLPTFVVSNRSRISELGKLPNLCGKLSILEMQNVNKAADAEDAKMKDKKNIKELVFSWNINSFDDLQNETDVLEKLRPHENIERLTIEKYGGRKFPDWLGNSSFSNVVFLRLTDCKNCSSLPSLGQLSSLKKLHIAKMERLESIGPEFYSNGSTTSINLFTSLQSLHFEEMPNWKQWLFFDVEEGEFPSLKELHIQNCQKLAGNLPKYLPSLTLLHIDECTSLEFRFEDSTGYPKLQSLHIIGCDSLENFPLGLFNKLEYLQIQKCSQLKYIEVSNDLHQVQALKFLGDLEVSDCSNLEYFSGSGLIAPNLTSFTVSNCRSLKSLPEEMCTLTSLESLSLSCCPMLESFQNGTLPRELKSLLIVNCDNLTPQKNWGLSKMKSLNSLTITGGCSDVKSFPEEGLLPASLTSLQVSKILELEILDLRGLQFLTSLKTLLINSCISLQSMSEGTLPSSLSCLIINECPLLKERCQAEQGDYWHRINHIPNIEICD